MTRRDKGRSGRPGSRRQLRKPQDRYDQRFKVMPNLECPHPSFIGFRYKNSPSSEPEIGIRPTSFWHLPQLDIFLNGGWYNLLSFSCVENNCCYILRGSRGNSDFSLGRPRNSDWIQGNRIETPKLNSSPNWMDHGRKYSIVSRFR